MAWLHWFQIKKTVTQLLSSTQLKSSTKKMNLKKWLIATHSVLTWSLLYQQTTDSLSLLWSISHGKAIWRWCYINQTSVSVGVKQRRTWNTLLYPVTADKAFYCPIWDFYSFAILIMDGSVRHPLMKNKLLKRLLKLKNYN